MCLIIKQQAGAIRSRLLLALLISALLHACLLYQSLDHKSVKQPKPDVITVTLAPKVAPVQPLPEPIPPKPKPAKAKPKLKPQTQKPKVISPQVAPLTPAVPVAVVPATKIVKVPPIEPDAEMPEPVEPAWTQKKAEPIDTSLPDVQETEVAPYLKVNSLYNVYADTAAQQQSRAVLGKATMVYQRDHNTYQLSSEVRPSGIMRLFLDDLIQQSSGTVTTKGLQPDYFLYEYDEKKYEVNFDWAEQQLKLHTHKGDKTAAMQVGTQDLLSFMFQFMFTSPLANTEMMVTNGKGVRKYQYQFMGEKLVETALGVFNTMHIVRDDAVKNEQLSLWLAVDYQYLPVKIKKTKTNKNKNYELVILKLQTDQGEVVGEQASNVSVQSTKADLQNDQVQIKPEPTSPTKAQPFNPLIQR